MLISTMFAMPGLSTAGLDSLVEQAEIVYPRPHVHDGVGRYALSVLRRCLALIAKPYVLRDSRAEPMRQDRELRELANVQHENDIGWTTTSRRRETLSLPVRVPLDSGLMGWRLPLIRQEDFERWQQIRSLDQLRTMVAGQGHDWPDVEILRANRLPVEVGSNHEALARMLARKRFDYFPRSVLEIEQEVHQFSQLPLRIAPQPLLRYPTALYFFVSKDRPTLAEELTTAMQTLVRRGELQAIFDQHFGALLERLHLHERQSLMLANPFLPDSVPLDDKAYWYRASPSGERRRR